MKAEQQSQTELVRRARKGDREAFGELLKMHKEYFYRTAFLYMKKEDLALEAFQEAIVQALMGIRNLKEPEYFKTWMTRIIYNCSMELYRKSSRTVSMEEEQVPELTAPVREDVQREEKMDLHQAIRKLEEPYQSVIVDKYFQGKKISEIAQERGKAEGTVKSELSRAKKQLRVILEEGYRYV